LFNDLITLLLAIYRGFKFHEIGFKK
jgi:hypothetical protein